jgi:hypothetical protein
MARRFNFVFRRFEKRFFGHFSLEPDVVERLKALEARGSVVYVMRYSSRLDYFLFNVLFLRHGLRLSSFANAISFYYYRPAARADPDRAAPRAGATAGGRAQRGLPVDPRDGARAPQRVPVPAHPAAQDLPARSQVRQAPGRARPDRRGRRHGDGRGRDARGLPRAPRALLDEGAAGGEPLPERRLRLADASLGLREGRALRADVPESSP